MHNIVISTCFLVIFAFKMSQSLKWLVIEYFLVYNFAVHLKKTDSWARTVGPKSAGPRTVGTQTAGPRTVGPGAHLSTKNGQLGPGQLGPRTIGPQSAGPRTDGPQTAGPPSVGPRQLGPGLLGPGQLGFSHKNQDRIKNVELYTHFRNCALPPQGPTGPKHNNQS